MSKYWCCKAEFGNHELTCKNYHLPPTVEAVLEAAEKMLEDKFFMSQYEDSNFIHHVKVHKDVKRGES